MRRVEIIRHPGAGQRQQLIDFVDSQTQKARRTDPIAGRPVSDQVWLDLRSVEPSEMIAVTVAEQASGATQVIAVGLITAVNEGWGLEVAVDPDFADTDRAAIMIDIADTALDAKARDGGGPITWWLDDAGAGASDVANGYGLAPTRILHEMRRPLPHPERASIETRPFELSGDVEAWLGVNNRAFAGHPEQGGWTSETLGKRFEEPWFEADGFRVFELDGQMAGFCWTKVESPVGVRPDDRLGEIYVIAVDPAFHGRGLGRQMTLAGLDWMADHGIRRATLYVDATNHAAVGLYERLGFDIERTRYAFAGTLNPI